jgi:hypothetical protein
MNWQNKGMENKDLERIEGEDLPLTTRDSQPPLVVDLPDGQKLVVGDLDPGTVIEIATWRGTGRPDSRTNRFMLGVSTNEDEGIPSKRSLSNRPEIGAPVTNIETVPSGVTQETSEITESSTCNQIATGVIYSNVFPGARNNQLSTTKNINRSSTILTRVAIWSGSISAVAALAFVLIVPVGLKFAHPASGATSAIGAVSNSLVVVKQDENLTVGKSVVVDLTGNKPSPVVAIVAAVSNEAILLSTDTGYVQVRKEQLHGKVVAVLPFLGQIANLFSR